MDQIRIGVRVPLAAAVAAGRAHYGYGVVALTDVDVASLSDRARGLLRAFGDSGSHEDQARRRGLVGLQDGLWTREIEVERADAPTTIAAIEAAAVALAAKAAADQADVDARIARAVAATDDEWITSSRQEEYYTDSGGALAASRTGHAHGRPEISRHAIPGVYLSEADMHDPRIVARIAAIDLVSRLAAHAARRAEWLAGVERADADRAARAQAWDAACREYVIRWCPEYARAARDGKNVRGLAKANSVAAATELLNSAGFETVEAYDGEPDDHPRPHQRAYDALDTVRRELERARSQEIAAAAAGLVSSVATRIVRADTCPETGCKQGLRACVEVQLTYGDESKEEIYVYADGSPQHVHESGEEEVSS